MAVTVSIPRYALHLRNDLIAADGSSGNTRVVKKSATVDTLHRLVGFQGGGGEATFFVQFTCTPSANVTYAGSTAGGVAEPPGHPWTGELEIKPTLKRREAIARLNALAVVGNPATEMPATIDVKAQLIGRMSVTQHREDFPTAAQHRAQDPLTFKVGP